LLITDEGHEGLVQVIKELEKLVFIKVIKDEDINDEINISM
jgi:hypothetical protein